MSKTKDVHWRLIRSFPDGHSYFKLLAEFSEQPKDDRIYVADQSGTSPDRTEDGRMWVDMARGLTSTWKHVSLAVVTPRSKREMHTTIGFDEALWLSQYLRIPIKALNGEFTVVLTKSD
jgi:hypothetical protein